MGGLAEFPSRPERPSLRYRVGQHAEVRTLRPALWVRHSRRAGAGHQRSTSWQSLLSARVLPPGDHTAPGHGLSLELYVLSRWWVAERLAGSHRHWQTAVDSIAQHSAALPGGLDHLGQPGGADAHLFTAIPKHSGRTVCRP